MTPKTIRYWTAGIAVAGTVLAYGDKIQNVPGLPGWAVHIWPFVYGAAFIFKEVAGILTAPTGSPPIPSPPPQPPKS